MKRVFPNISPRFFPLASAGEYGSVVDAVKSGALSAVAGTDLRFHPFPVAKRVPMRLTARSSRGPIPGASLLAEPRYIDGSMVIRRRII